MRMTIVKRLALAGLAAMLPVLAHAATLTVTTTEDAFDAKCDQQCSLRDAVRVAQNGDVVTLPQGTYFLNGELRIKSSLHLSGAGVGLSILDGKKLTRLGYIHPGVSATFSGISFQNGFSQESGGCLVNAGSLTLQDSQFSGCVSQKSGGAVMNRSGTLKVVNTTFNGNQAKEMGGSIEHDGVSLELIHASFEGNAAFRGGAINTAGGNASLRQAQIINNKASEQGGGIWVGNAQTVGLENSTIKDNNAPAGADCLGVLMLKGALNVIGDIRGCTTPGPATPKKPKIPTIPPMEKLKGTGIGGGRGTGSKPKMNPKITPVTPVIKNVPKGAGIGGGRNP